MGDASEPKLLRFVRSCRCSPTCTWPAAIAVIDWSGCRSEPLIRRLIPPSCHRFDIGQFLFLFFLDEFFPPGDVASVIAHPDEIIIDYEN